MNRFTIGDLVKVPQPGSVPKIGFILSNANGLYTIEYLDATVEENVDFGRLKKQSMSATVHGRPALITDRRMLRGETEYKYSVNFTDSWNENPERVAMVDISEIGPPSPSKGGRTRSSRYKKAKKSKKRTRRR